MPDRIEELEAVYRESLRGHTVAASAALSVEAPSSAARARQLALRGALALIDGTHAPPNAVELSTALPSGELAFDACSHAETFALVTFDRPALATLSELRARHSEVDATDPRLGRARLMCALLAGDPQAAPAAAAHWVELAERRGRHDLVVELLALQALGAFRASEVSFAVEHARRAVRTAREHDLRIGRYLASIVLARMRRLSGRPHLAARILSTLMPLLPAAWRGWLHWELELSGEPLREEKLHDTPSARCVYALRNVFDACARSTHDFHTRADELRECVVDCQLLKEEVACVLALIDWSVSAGDVPAACAEFVRGEIAEVPLGLHGLVADPGSSSAAPVAYVSWHPARPPRRVLGMVAPALSRATGAAVLELSRLHAGRADVALATLALAGESGMEEAALFRECYGFRYSPRVHEAALGMLIHRARSRLPEQVLLARDQGRLRLVGDRPLLVPDPRCAEHVEGRLLRLVARDGAVTTRSAARSLGVSLRTVQSAMARLVERGECMLDRSGRHVVYRVDDTSYTIPTRSGGA